MLDRQGASRIQAEVLDLMQPRWWACGAESRMRACAGGFGSPRRLGRGGGSPCEGVFPVLSAWVLWRKGEDIATFPCSLWHWGMWFSDGGVEGQVDGWTILKVVSNLNNSIILASWVTLGSWDGEGDTNFIISGNTYVPVPADKSLCMWDAALDTQNCLHQAATEQGFCGPSFWAEAPKSLQGEWLGCKHTLVGI